jgi:hypothetical protein
VNPVRGYRLRCKKQEAKNKKVRKMPGSMGSSGLLFYFTIAPLTPPVGGFSGQAFTIDIPPDNYREAIETP